jgi:hypothetical protein
MTTTVNRIDWDAAEARLATRTKDAAVLEAFRFHFAIGCSSAIFLGSQLR